MPAAQELAGADARRRYLAVLAVLFAAEWVALGVAPRYRADWALENALVVVLVGALAASYRRLPLSRLSYTLIFAFLLLHEVGAHYTYAEVPYDDWARRLTGHGLNHLLGWRRNHFDRFVHLCYGLLLAYPVRELFLRVANVTGFWGYFLPLDLTMSTSLTFELFEWWAAALVGGDLGMAYLGTQGDIWDAHRDMALAALGAAIAMTVTAAVNLRLRRDFAREWAESLRVKRPEPLGEEEIARLRRRRR
jgi:putative membrane protein